MVQTSGSSKPSQVYRLSVSDDENLVFDYWVKGVFKVTKILLSALREDENDTRISGRFDEELTKDLRILEKVLFEYPFEISTLEGVRIVRLSAGGTTSIIITQSDDESESLNIWNTMNMIETSTIALHADNIPSVVVDSCGKRFATENKDDIVTLYEQSENDAGIYRTVRCTYIHFEITQCCKGYSF